ncbi:hypothetical protein [Ekhidna sp.]|uniref:hypothetical protein n=1 Tax=Ekhidna sp. TaxID=2608089 RepID=UPI003C7DCD8D
MITVKVVANSTNIMDSHLDVHIPGNYNESIYRKEGWNHLKDHKQFSDGHVGIVKNVTAEQVSFEKLGISATGSTECLIYRSEVLEELDEKIHNSYKLGLIKQHSIGMRYREIELAINDKESPKEKAVWDQYINQIANPEKAEEATLFYVVKNIELIECSAVLRGSNSSTPTLVIDHGQKVDYVLANAARNKRLRTYK